MKLTKQEKQVVRERWLWSHTTNPAFFTISELNREREAAEKRHEQEEK